MAAMQQPDPDAARPAPASGGGWTRPTRYPERTDGVRPHIFVHEGIEADYRSGLGIATGSGIASTLGGAELAADIAASARNVPAPVPDEAIQQAVRHEEGAE